MLYKVQGCGSGWSWPGSGSKLTPFEKKSDPFVKKFESVPKNTTQIRPIFSQSIFLIQNILRCHYLIRALINEILKKLVYIKMFDLDLLNTYPSFSKNMDPDPHPWCKVWPSEVRLMLRYIRMNKMQGAPFFLLVRPCSVLLLAKYTHKNNFNFYIVWY